jgi:hypothetical protein
LFSAFAAPGCLRQRAKSLLAFVHFKRIVHFRHNLPLGGALALKSFLIDVISSKAVTFECTTSVYLHVVYGLRVLFFGTDSQAKSFTFLHSFLRGASVLAFAQFTVLEMLAAKTCSVEGGELFG